MPAAAVNGVELYYEDVGEGAPLVWAHEFADDCRSLAPQVRYFARRHRVITYNYRGWPPSTVPDAPTAYSTEVFVEDLAALLRHLGIARADLVGLSMGANIALSFAVKHPAAVASLTIVGCGSGSVAHDAFLEESERLATVFEKHGAVVAAARIAQRANRRVYAAKDPEGFAEFIARLGARSAHGAAATIRGVLMTRPTLFEMEDDLRRIEAPMLIIAGDRDDGALEPSIFLRRTARHGSLVVLPFTGHTPNLEEPLTFNTQVADFLAAVARGRWAE